MRVASQPSVSAYKSQAKFGGNIMLNGGYFLNLGTNVLFDKGLRFGATGAGGIGVRLQSPDSSTKYDITLGYQALMLSPRPIINAPYGYEPKDVKRLELNQQVFLGFGVTF